MSYRDELGQAHSRIAQLEGELQARDASLLRAPPSRTGRFVVLGLLAALVLLGVPGVLGYRAYRASKAPTANVSVAEAIRNHDRYAGRTMRVQGELVEKSMRMEGEPTNCRLSFVLEREGLRLPVRLDDCGIPWTYRDAKGALVVAEGTLEDDGRAFHALQVLVRWDPPRGTP